MPFFYRGNILAYGCRVGGGIFCGKTQPPRNHPLEWNLVRTLKTTIKQHEIWHFVGVGIVSEFRKNQEYGYLFLVLMLELTMKFSCCYKDENEAYGDEHDAEDAGGGFSISSMGN